MISFVNYHPTAQYPITKLCYVYEPIREKTILETKLMYSQLWNNASIIY